MAAPAARQRVLALYRALLREGRLMPTENRKQFVWQRVRAAFRDARTQDDAQQLEFLLQLGDTQLENLTVQRQLLNKLAEEGNLKS
jgi:hypothetical protein